AALPHRADLAPQTVAQQLFHASNVYLHDDIVKYAPGGWLYPRAAPPSGRGLKPREKALEPARHGVARRCAVTRPALGTVGPHLFGGSAAVPLPQGCRAVFSPAPPPASCGV